MPRQPTTPQYTFRTEKDIEKIPPPMRSDDPSAKVPQPLIAKHATEPGFCIRIMPPTAATHAAWMASGRKRPPKTTRVWVVRIGMEWRKIADYPGMSLEEARLHAITERQKYEEAIASGIAPASKDTVGDIVEAFKSHKGSGWSRDTWVNYSKRVEYLKRPQPGVPSRVRTENGVWHMKARRLTTQHCEKLFDEILVNAKNTNLERGLKGDGRGQQAAIARLLNAALNYGVGTNRIRTNVLKPLTGMYFDVTKRRRSRYIRVRDIPRFFHWLEEHAPSPQRDFIMITLFMCLRKSVVANLKWEWLDTHRWVLRIPKEVPGNKTETFVHPIPDLLIKEVFEPRLKAPDKHPVWIIPSVSRDADRKGKTPLKDVRSLLDGLYKLTSEGRCKRCRREGEDGIRISPHDWRRSFGTWMHQATKNTLLTRRALQHSLFAPGDTDSTSAGYVITEVEELRTAMNLTMEYVFNIVNNPEVIDEAAYQASAERVAKMLRRDKRTVEAAGATHDEAA